MEHILCTFLHFVHWRTHVGDGCFMSDRALHFSTGSLVGHPFIRWRTALVDGDWHMARSGSEMPLVLHVLVCAEPDCANLGYQIMTADAVVQRLLDPRTR